MNDQTAIIYNLQGDMDIWLNSGTTYIEDNPFTGVGSFDLGAMNSGPPTAEAFIPAVVPPVTQCGGKGSIQSTPWENAPA